MQLPEALVSERIDKWVWAVRLAPTRSAAAAACRAGHIKLNDVRVKPAAPVRVGDRIEIRGIGGPGVVRIVEVTQVITRRVGAPIAVQCYADHSPPPPSKEILASMPQRERGSGRPTKRDRRALDRLRRRDETQL